MAFSFNFAIPSTNGAVEVLEDVKNDIITKDQDPSPETLEKAEEVTIDDNYEPCDYDVMEIKLSSGEIIQYIDSHIIEEKIKHGDINQSDRRDSSLEKALSSGSDLEANVYEGGLKIWECCIDLVHYLSENEIKFQGLNVLELGCGAGIPGLFAYCQGANVHFTDYNWEVLKYITIPNVLFNTEAESGDEKVRCRFFSGDWANLVEMLTDKSLKYDLILTSETIYNTANYDKLLKLMAKVLKPDGIIYLAAKTQYFGVGGSIGLFEVEIEKQRVFDVNEVKVFDEGLQRKIMRLKFKNR